MSNTGFLNFSEQLLHKQREALFADRRPRSPFEPWSEVSLPREKEKGVELLKEGKVACVILAGGQGSRLGWSGPKALYPIIPEKNLTLLQILLSKVQKLTEEFGRPFEVAVMTSLLNTQEIQRHAEEHNFYGLPKSNLTFFPQNVLPLLDEKGNWFEEKPGQLAVGPDGNGGVFELLVEKGILDRWKSQGIEYVSVLPIDNALADPFDPYLIHESKKGSFDVVAKAIERIDPEEKIGVFASDQGKLCVVEYSELPQEKKTARGSDGKFSWPYANIGQFAFSLSFVENVAKLHLPWHIARKKATCCRRGEIECAKCETFLFDALPFARKTSLLLYAREDCYAPLKNKEGDKSPDAVRSKIGHLI